MERWRQNGVEDVELGRRVCSWLEASGMEWWRQNVVEEVELGQRVCSWLTFEDVAIYIRWRKDRLEVASR